MIRIEDLSEMTSIYKKMLKSQTELLAEDAQNKVLIDPEIKDGEHPLERYNIATITKFNLGDYSSSFQDKTDLSKILLYSVSNNTIYKIVKTTFDDLKDDFEDGEYSPEIAFKKLLPVVDTAINLYNEATKENIELAIAQRALVAKQLLFHFTKDLKQAFNISTDIPEQIPDYSPTEG